MGKLFLYDREVKKVETVRSYIENNLDKELRISFLASLVTIGESTLRNYFFTYYNQRIHQFIKNARLEKGKELLLTSSFTVQQISMIVGFKERTSFSLAFKEYSGHSPQEFRLMNKTSQAIKI